MGVSSGAGAGIVGQSGPGSTGDLQVSVSSVGSSHDVRLSGELDIATAPLLVAELRRLASEGAVQVAVDLADLAFIDSTGLSVLINGLKRLRQQGGDMTLRSPTPGTRKVLEITGLTELFSIS